MANAHPVQPCLGYLSAAPRVSTRPDAEALAPRAHVLGLIAAFEALGWRVLPYIVGDRMPRRVRTGAEEMLRTSRTRTVASDLIRLGMGPLSAWRAWRQLGTGVEFVYERLAAFQALGGIFKQHGIPWVLETNSPHFVESLVDRKSAALASILRRREIAAYRSCDLVVCVSDALKRIVVETAGIDEAKVMVMPNAADLALFSPERATAVRSFSGFTVGFVGYLIAWQGLDLLLKAVAGLRDSGLPVNAVLVGDGPERQPLEHLVRVLGLEDEVRFIGRVPREEVPAYIAGFDLAYSGQVPLAAGEMYNSPLKLYEYMAMAKPVVASAFADAQSLIDGKGTGFLFRPGDLDDLRSVLQTAYANQESLPAMGALARRLVVAHHSWTARARELLPRVEALRADRT